MGPGTGQPGAAQLHSPVTSQLHGPAIAQLPRLATAQLPRPAPCLMISGMLVGTEFASTMDSVVTAQ